MRGFLLLFSAGIGCGLLGCGAGWLVGSLSPEFIALLTFPTSPAEPGRLGAALGAISGLLLGLLAMAFGLLVEAFREWVRRGKARIDAPRDEPPPRPSVRPAQPPLSVGIKRN